MRRGRRRPYVARAELVLARPDTDPLGELNLKPDPLQAFALAFGRVREDLQETADVVIDVMPASGREQRQLRKRLERTAERDAKKRQPSNGPGVFDLMVGETGSTSRRANTAQTVHQRSDVRHLWTKLGEDQPLFRVQVLIRAESEIKGRAEAHVKALETCFRQFAGKNHWKVAGWRIPGVVFFGADSWWRRSYFDYRFSSGLFRPAQRSVVNAAEIGGLLKPPTVHCKAPGVVRAGAAVAAAPRDLPTYRFRPGVLPLGEVMRDDELVRVGMDVDEFFFGGLFGRSRFGKALALDTPIPTPAGWTTMGELREGDQVFDETGGPCTITAAAEVMHDRACFEVVFSDGSTIVADAEHRWLTMDARARKLRDARLEHADYVRVLDMLDTPGGVVLAPDPGEIACVRTTAEIEATVLVDDAPNHTIQVARPLAYAGGPLPLAARVIGEHLGSRWARIPTDYLHAGEHDRRALLLGLAQGPHTENRGSETTVRCIDRGMAEDVLELVTGLGMIGQLHDDGAEAHAMFPTARYRVSWWHDCRGVDQSLEESRAIVDVRAVASVPVRCIAVDSLSHLYLAGRGCIPTHNTELALVQFVHAALIEQAGALFFDPHQDAIARVKPYLSDVADRVIEINLARRGMDSTHVAWNLLSMQGHGQERVAERAAAVIDSFAVGAGWSGRSAGRTMAILSNAVYSLLYLALRCLPDELQPTIFTLPRFLIDKDWRDSTLNYLPEHLQRYWTTTYDSYPGDAAGPLCQLISRLQTNPVVAATFGSPQSTYDPRRAMDQRAVILMCPPSGKEHLVTNLLMQGHIDAARSRADLPADQRPRAYWWMDEAPAFDRATENAGTSSLAEVLEQCAKYGIRAMPMSQSPHRLSDSTIEALTTNASLLITTATSPKGARFFGDQWEAMDAKRAVQQLERFHYIGQPTHHGRRVEPFRIAGIAMDDFWGEYKHPERIPALEAAIDEACRPSTVAQTLTLIEGHDERILQHLTGAGRRGQPSAAASSPALAPPPAPTYSSAEEMSLDDVEAAAAAAGAVAPPAVAPRVGEPLLGGVTIKRRRRGATSGEPATLPVSDDAPSSAPGAPPASPPIDAAPEPAPPASSPVDTEPPPAAVPREASEAADPPPAYVTERQRRRNGQRSG